MSSRLDSKFQIHQLAHDLGLPASASPTKQIISFLEKRVRQIYRKYKCGSLSDLLDAVAGEVDTTVCEIETDDGLWALQEEYVRRGELIFGNLDADLSKDDDYGLTIKLTKHEPWDRPYVSIIDCRGPKRFRSYFTKWHELAHLLTLTAQTRLMFRRSHSRECALDPEEKLMDVIAGTFGFFPDLMPEMCDQEISFPGIAAIRQEFCPDASVQSSLIGIVKALPTPCILLHVAPAFKKDETPGLEQGGFGFLDAAMPPLRAVYVTVNTAAREAEISFFRNWRVPEGSIINSVFESGIYGEADEDLSWWAASGGRHLAPGLVRVKAQKVGGAVQVLLIPLAA